MELLQQSNTGVIYLEAQLDVPTYGDSEQAVRDDEELAPWSGCVRIA